MLDLELYEVVPCADDLVEGCGCAMACCCCTTK